MPMLVLLCYLLESNAYVGTVVFYLLESDWSDRSYSWSYSVLSIDPVFLFT